METNKDLRTNYKPSKKYLCDATEDMRKKKEKEHKALLDEIERRNLENYNL